jgi:CubicO group peptidase (beta-lactamase class C family)
VCCLLSASRSGTAALPEKPDFAHVDQLRGYQPIEIAPAAPDRHPTPAPTPDRRLDTAMTDAQTYSDAHGGLALLVWQGGRLRYKRYAAGIGADTRSETFSMHKSVLGLVYGAALRDRVIGSIDDPAGTYLPEWRHDARGAITLRQLLSMDSGLHAYGFHDPAYAALASGSEVSATALATPADQPLGGSFQYNNVNSQVAPPL